MNEMYLQFLLMICALVFFSKGGKKVGSLLNTLET